MLEPIYQRTWSRPDKRAWSLSISLLFLMVVFAVTAFVKGRDWTYRVGIEYVPKEIQIRAYDIGSDLMEFSVNLPDYAFGEYFVVEQIRPESALYLPALLVFLVGISLLAASISYFEGTVLYACLAGFGLGTTLFGPDLFIPLSAHGPWIIPAAVLAICLPIYGINGWMENWNLARRWWVLLVWYGLLCFLLLVQGQEVLHGGLVVAQLWFPLLIASILYLILNSTDVYQTLVTLLTREENNTQSWLHFTLFSLLYMSNFLLLYLKNTGQLVLDIIYINPFIVQALTTILGFWALEKKAELLSGDDVKTTGVSGTFVSLAILFGLTCALAAGLANDLMLEVLEDAICLINFGMGLSFFLYVLINYFQLMGMGLRVHLVLFKPRYMPVFGIPVFGLGAVVLFQMNVGYFTFQQSLGAKEILLADHARLVGDAFEAENHLRLALGYDYRTPRSNLSLAGLYLEEGNPAKAFAFAEASMDKNPSPEAYLTMAQIYREKKSTLEEILQLREGLKLFPGDGRMMNNLGMAFHETIMKDSALHYFSQSAQQSVSANAGKANLGFFFLANKLGKEGLPKKSAESENLEDWAQLNNNLVFANVAREKASNIADLHRIFAGIPESMQPFILYHALQNQAITKDSTGFGMLCGLENDSIRQYYGEPIRMAKHLVEYRNGKVKDGLQGMVALYQSKAQKRPDETLLIGQLYYEQGAYTTASEYFRNAMNMGDRNARFWYAISSLDAGRRSEAAEAFRETLSGLSAADKVRVAVLIDGLSSGKVHNAAQRSDPEKSAFIKTNWNQVEDAQLKDLIYLMTDKEAQRFLWNYAMERAYRESMTQRVQVLYQFGQQFFGKNPKWVQLLKQHRPWMLEISGQWKSLEKMKAAGQLQDYPFILGRLAATAKDTAEAKRQFKLALEQAPLHNRQMGFLISWFASQPGLLELAYAKSLELSDLDPGNVEMTKLYGLMAIRMGLPEFAYPMVGRVSLLTTPEVARLYREQLDQELKAKGYVQPEPTP